MYVYIYIYVYIRASEDGRRLRPMHPRCFIVQQMIVIIIIIMVSNSNSNSNKETTPCGGEV